MVKYPDAENRHNKKRHKIIKNMNKNKDIMDAWNSSTPMDATMLHSAGSVLEKAEAKEKAVRKARRAWISSVMALMVVALGTGIYVKNNAPVRLVAEGKKQHYELPDGSSIWLNRSSSLSYKSSFGKSERRVKLTGEAFFDVAKDSRAFVVETGRMDITVHGTRFTVSAYGDGEQSAWLEEGSISVKGHGLSETTLSPDQKVCYEGGEWTVSEEPASCHTSWINDRLVLENRSLSEIVSALEHWYGTGLTVSDPEEAKGIFLSLTVRSEELDAILEAINLLSDVQVSR